MEKYIIAYLIIINIAGLFVMWLDKYKARRHLWRIPEKTLFFVSLIGGSAGAICGMYMFRHKTKHWYFVIGFPIILMIQIALGIWLYSRYIV